MRECFAQDGPIKIHGVSFLEAMAYLMWHIHILAQLPFNVRKQSSSHQVFSRKKNLCLKEKPKFSAIVHIVGDTVVSRIAVTICLRECVCRTVHLNCKHFETKSILWELHLTGVSIFAYFLLRFDSRRYRDLLTRTTHYFRYFDICSGLKKAGTSLLKESQRYNEI